jgi:hypothetical protein
MLVIGLILGVAAVVWILSISSGAPDASASPSLGAIAVGSSATSRPGGTSPPAATAAAGSPTLDSTKGPSAEPSSEPTEGGTPTPSPILEQTFEPTLSPTIEPTPSPTPTPRPTPEPTPTQQLGFDFPRDGQVVHTRVINVAGTAPAGATITRDIPMWFDDHAVARGDGTWLMSVELAEGENLLRFRVGDDRATERTLAVRYTPRS